MKVPWLVCNNSTHRVCLLLLYVCTHSYVLYVLLLFRLLSFELNSWVILVWLTLSPLTTSGFAWSSTGWFLFKISLICTVSRVTLNIILTIQYIKVGITWLFNLAVLAAGAPHLAPFMADECLLSMPDCDSTLDYTMKEYMKLVDLVNQTVERLNKEGTHQATTSWAYQTY